MNSGQHFHAHQAANLREIASCDRHGERLLWSVIVAQVDSGLAADRL